MGRGAFCLGLSGPGAFWSWAWGLWAWAFGPGPLGLWPSRRFERDYPDDQYGSSRVAQVGGETSRAGDYPAQVVAQLLHLGCPKRHLLRSLSRHRSCQQGHSAVWAGNEVARVRGSCKERPQGRRTSQTRIPQRPRLQPNTSKLKTVRILAFIHPEEEEESKVRRVLARAATRKM